MGMKPRKCVTQPRMYPMLSFHTRECIDDYAGAIRSLLKEYKIPKPRWNSIWDGVEDWPEADADQDLHWFIGFFNGLAEAMACNLEDLVVL